MKYAIIRHNDSSSTKEDLCRQILTVEAKDQDEAWERFQRLGSFTAIVQKRQFGLWYDILPAIVMLLLFLGCSSTPTEPRWLTIPPGEHCPTGVVCNR